MDLAAFTLARDHKPPIVANMNKTGRAASCGDGRKRRTLITEYPVSANTGKHSVLLTGLITAEIKRDYTSTFFILCDRSV